MLLVRTTITLVHSYNEAASQDELFLILLIL